MIPTEGFTKDLLLTFDHSATCKHATAATCDMNLRLPVSFQGEDFKDIMIASRFGDCGFSLR